jgi:hypothetical protein
MSQIGLSYPIYREVTHIQDIPLCSYLKQAKCHFFSSFFSYTTWKNRRAEQILPRWEGSKRGTGAGG